MPKTSFLNNNKCFIVAEVSANHGQDLKTAIKMIKEAKRCGADAVKFQVYTPDTLTINSDKKYFQVKHPKWGGQTLYELYKKAYTPWDWLKKLKKVADDNGLIFFSTAYDMTSVDYLEELEVPFHKVSSFELVDIPLIEYMAKTKKPLILSTGMASLSEIKEAVDAAKGNGAKDVVLLKCVSSYPADPLEMNLRTMPDMADKFNVDVGISDHTLNSGVSVAAVALGAKMVEKHFTLSRKMKTPDSFFSSEPHELKDLIDNIRIAESAIGKIRYGITEKEKESRIFRRSLFAVRDIKKGEIFTEENIRAIRPAGGLKPKYMKFILKKKSLKNIKKGTPINRGFIR
ncbi:MAG: pseudaminic acid synthase [Candidatus Omnitrophica bacterium]|nr:pseudaminic acid synthase [Candidatus Omnitrophota bacterium]